MDEMKGDGGQGDGDDSDEDCAANTPDLQCGDDEDAEESENCLRRVDVAEGD